MRKLIQVITNSDPWLTALVLGCLTIAGVCAVYAGRATAHPEGVTVVTFCQGGSKRDRAETRALQARFEAEHPDIRLNIIRSNQARKPDTMIAAGVAPDLIFVPCDQADYYIQSGALRDLKPLLREDPELVRALGTTVFSEAELREVLGPEHVPGAAPDFIAAMVAPFLREGPDGRKQLFAIPINYTPFFIYYNKDLFDKYNVPYPSENWTWDELREKALALTRDHLGRRPDQPGFDAQQVQTFGFQYAWWQHGVECFIRQNGGRLVSEDGSRVVANDPRTVEALQFLNDLKRRDGVVPTGQGATARDIAFNKGTIGMFMWGVFEIVTLNDQTPELDYDVAPLPRGRDGTRASVVFPNGWGITAQSRVPEAAFAYLRFLASREAMQLTEDPVFLPTRYSVLGARGPVDPTRRPTSRWALTHDIDNGYAMAPYGTTAYYGDVYEVINEHLNKLLNLVEPPFDAQTAADEMTRLGNVILQRDRLVRGSTSFGYAALAIALIPLGYLAWRFATRPRRGLSKLLLAEERWGYLLISPWVLGFTLFGAFPILVSILLSFSQWQSLSDFTQAEFIGVENYRVALSGTDPKFWTSLWVTFRYALLAVPSGLVAGLALALLMNQAVAGITVFRTLYYIPAVLPSVAAAILWWYLFDRHTGWVNWALARANVLSPLQVILGLALVVLLIVTALAAVERARGARGNAFARPLLMLAGGLAALVLLSPRQPWIEALVTAGVAEGPAGGWARLLDAGWATQLAGAVGARYPVAWLSDEVVTPYVFVIMALWGVGGGMIIYLAGLQGIPTQLYEAAEMDGASRWQKLRNVTIPMLSPVIFFNLIMGVIGSFQVFNSAYVLFDGGTGPGDSALFYGLHLFREAFMKYRLGYASALAWILFVIILVFTALIFRSSALWVYYESAKGKRA